MAQIFIQLQTPIIELEVKSEKDPSGESGKIRVGFKRYDAFAGQKKFAEVLNALQEAEKSTEKTEKTEEEKEEKEPLKATPEEAFKKLHEIVLKEVEYICKAIIKVQEGVTIKELTVDTRKPPTDLWTSSEEAVSELLKMYLSSTPWRSNFLSTMFDSFSNRDLSDLAEIKN